MDSLNVLGLIYVFVFLGLILATSFILRTRESRRLRDIPAFERLGRAIGLAVEAGSRLHISLGRGHLLTNSGKNYWINPLFVCSWYALFYPGGGYRRKPVNWQFWQRSCINYRCC